MDTTYLEAQAASLRDVIAALRAAAMDTTTYEKALASVERMLAQEAAAQEG